MTDDGIRPELSRRIAVARLPEGGAEHRIEADAAERAALMRRFGLLALDRFTALVRIERLGHGAVRVESTITADLAQECVVTLEPVPQHIETPAGVHGFSKFVEHDLAGVDAVEDLDRLPLPRLRRLDKSNKPLRLNRPLGIKVAGAALVVAR